MLVRQRAENTWMFRRVWRAYQARLQTSPYVTNMINTCLFATGGDVAAQYLESQNSGKQTLEWNRARSTIMGTWGGLAFAPFFTWLFRTMDTRLAGVLARRSIYVVALSKCFLTFLTAPLVNSAYFAYSTSLEHAHRSYTARKPYPTELVGSEIQHKISTRLPTVVASSVALWFPINFVSFVYVPPHMRIVLSSVVSVGWNCYLSLT